MHYLTAERVSGCMAVLCRTYSSDGWKKEEKDWKKEEKVLVVVGRAVSVCLGS
jgi:hypothetical protein